ncbi:LysR family transcriptional regulator [Altererythrobacter sp.]|uniref:LysR family transcriptional regulator n=1 Tax=Altererythrobacter sp. TaxID=1872480 RepID=UPI003CFEF35E
MKRTHLPLNALRVYDAAARHLSFTRAADELAVTPAAVGQQIRALEDHLGVVLFRRTSKGLELTEEGCAGLDALREGFLRFEESVQAMQAGQASDRYTIAVPREFYAQWLSTRLASFQAQSPQTQFHLVADENADFTEANLDVAIRLVDGPGELEGVQLAPAEKVVVAAPGGADGWIEWPGASLPDGEQATVKAGNPGQALSSAVAGMGRAILPRLLVAEAVEAGKLEILEGPDPGRRSYWLVAPLPQWRQKKVKALVAHLTA